MTADIQYVGAGMGTKRAGLQMPVITEVKACKSRKNQPNQVSFFEDTLNWKSGSF